MDGVLEPVKALDIEKSADMDLRERILSAYDITVDNRQLKEPLSRHKQVSEMYFDQLRKNYPVRREFLTECVSITTKHKH